MAVLSVQQAAQYASAAGFSGAALRTAVSIAQAESGLNTAITSGLNRDGSVDRGLYQVNSKAWSNISDSVCYSPSGASGAAYIISMQGHNFGPWSTYNSGAYRNTSAWSQLANQPTGNPGAGVGWSAAKSLNTWPWLTRDGATLNLNNPYHSSFEPSHGLGTQYGVGVPTEFHTVITSLSSGLVLDAFYKDYGGVILVRTFVQGRGQETLYYLHMDDIYVKVGDTVTVGQPLGLSGGQVTGGDHPAGMYSTGPHIDVGYNNPNLGKTLGPNFDPTPWLASRIQSGPPLADILVSSGNPIVSTFGLGLTQAQTLSDSVASGSGPLADNFTSLFAALDRTMAMRPLVFNQQAIPNPVANIPIIGGIVGGIETPVNAIGSGVAFAGGIADWIGNNARPLMLRSMVMLFGYLLCFAVVAAMLATAVKDSGIVDAAKDVAAVAS